MAIVLIGFMGAGKSSAAVALAGELGVEPIDTDVLLEERFGHSVAEEFERAGETSFRAQEEELAGRLLEQAGTEEVIALGGGSVLSERVRNALAGHVTVLLDVEPEEAWRRVGENAGARPLASEEPAFRDLHARRSGLYESLADAILEGLPVDGAAGAAATLRALHGAPAGTRMLWAHSSGGEYPVLVGRGLLGDPARLAALWPLERDRSRCFCVSDTTVAGLYGGAIDQPAATITIEPGEQHKTISGAEHVWRELAAAGMTRADHLAAIGGGVVGDLAGFCAATYQRGVPVVQLPTTLLAQVDSAYGGKTGVDLPQAKNYVGAFHQPAGVIADVDALASLPDAELAAGWVEVLKTALIAGGRLWESVLAGADVDELTILDCARTKLAVVAADERDGGRRQVLNLGHTVGHAIETATAYRRYRHGEAVGLGLLAALRLSGLEPLRATVADLLAARGLPTRLEGTTAQEVLVALRADKKRLREAVPFVLVRAPGEVEFGCEVSEQDLSGAVEELFA